MISILNWLILYSFVDTFLIIDSNSDNLEYILASNCIKSLFVYIYLKNIRENMTCPPFRDCRILLCSLVIENIIVLDLDVIFFAVVNGDGFIYVIEP